LVAVFPLFIGVINQATNEVGPTPTLVEEEMPELVQQYVLELSLNLMESWLVMM